MWLKYVILSALVGILNWVKISNAVFLKYYHLIYIQYRKNYDWSNINVLLDTRFSKPSVY